MKIKNISQNGFGLIEILLVVGVGMATFLGIEQYLSLSLRAALQDSHQTEALYWAKSNLEQARAARDELWDYIYNPLIDVDGKYHFAILTDVTNPDKWVTAAGPIVEGRYTIWIINSAVQRNNTTKDIDTSGINVYDDSDTLKINSYVSWVENGALKQVTVLEYLADF